MKKLEVNPVEFKAFIKNVFESAMEDSFLTYQPYEKTDAEIIADAKERASDEKYDWSHLINRSCSIVTIASVPTLFYGNHDYEVVTLENSRNRTIHEAKFTQFRWPRFFNTGEGFDGIYFIAKPNDPRLKSCLNNEEVEPDIFKNMVGEYILIGYYTQVISDFKKPEIMVSLYTLGHTDSESAEIIRRQILQTQLRIVNRLLRYPSSGIISDTGMFNGDTFLKYQAEEFNSSFRTTFLAKRQQLLSELSKRNIFISDPDMI